MMDEKIATIPFAGLESEWREWSAKFLARAHLHGYKEILVGSVKIPPERKRHANEEEMSYLMAHLAGRLCSTSFSGIDVCELHPVVIPYGLSRYETNLYYRCRSSTYATGRNKPECCNLY